MCMISGVGSKNKGNRLEGKIVLKNKDHLTEKKNKINNNSKETENSIAGSLAQFICSVAHVIWNISFVISKPFFSLPKTWN